MQGGESQAEVAQRIVKRVEQIAEQHPGKLVMQLRKNLQLACAHCVVLAPDSASVLTSWLAQVRQSCWFYMVECYMLATGMQLGLGFMAGM